MGLHTYCIVPAGHPLPDDCVGLEGVRPRALRAGALDVWVSEHPAPIAPSADAARMHNDVVRAAMTPQVTPVPVRFGQWFAEATAAAERILEDEAHWATLLERFAGRAEYGVHVLRAGQSAERDVHPAAAETGREYMAALAGKQARAADRREAAERVAARIAGGIGALAADQRVDRTTTGDVLVSVIHLVAWGDVDAYHGALEELRGSWQDGRIVVTGPWPPYSFVE